jgi:TDG/mug DNA glycosylase family protein
MPRAVLPDVLADGLDVVFCGSAVGAASAKKRAYYAGPGNRFWPTLAKFGFTDRRLAPHEYPLVLTYGLGLTDMNKRQSGADSDLERGNDDTAGLRRKIERYRPLVLAFNGLRAARAFLGPETGVGRQSETIGETAIYVLPSTSGAAAGHWNEAPWSELARYVREAKRFRRDEPDLSRLTDIAKEDMRVSLNRRLYHRIGLDLRKKRDESEFASHMTSAGQSAQQQAAVVAIVESFFAGSGAFWPGAKRNDKAALVARFFALYPTRPIADNEGGIKLADSLWLHLLASLAGPSWIIESGTHRGHSAWLLRQACPSANMHCFDASFRNLAWRDPAITYQERDWSQPRLPPPDRDRALCFFDDHINHAQRIVEAHAAGYRWLVFDDDVAAFQLHATGHPPLPTVSVIADRSLADGETLTWLRHGKEHRWTVDAAAIAAARRRIRNSARTPDLAPILRSRPQSGMALVELE